MYLSANLLIVNRFLFFVFYCFFWFFLRKMKIFIRMHTCIEQNVWEIYVEMYRYFNKGFLKFYKVFTKIFMSQITFLAWLTCLAAMTFKRDLRVFTFLSIRSVWLALCAFIFFIKFGITQTTEKTIN